LAFKQLLTYYEARCSVVFICRSTCKSSVISTTGIIQINRLVKPTFTSLWMLMYNTSNVHNVKEENNAF
jgi:hypothetical protein